MSRSSEIARRILKCNFTASISAVQSDRTHPMKLNHTGCEPAFSSPCQAPAPIERHAIGAS